MSHRHDHTHGPAAGGRILAALNVGIAVAQIVVGLLSGSLAPLSDAARAARAALEATVAVKNCLRACLRERFNIDHATFETVPAGGDARDTSGCLVPGQ